MLQTKPPFSKNKCKIRQWCLSIAGLPARWINCPTPLGPSLRCRADIHSHLEGNQIARLLFHFQLWNSRVRSQGSFPSSCVQVAPSFCFQFKVEPEGSEPGGLWQILVKEDPFNGNNTEGKAWERAFCPTDMLSVLKYSVRLYIIYLDFATELWQYSYLTNCLYSFCKCKHISFHPLWI